MRERSTTAMRSRKRCSMRRRVVALSERSVHESVRHALFDLVLELFAHVADDVLCDVDGLASGATCEFPAPFCIASGCGLGCSASIHASQRGHLP